MTIVVFSYHCTDKPKKFKYGLKNCELRGNVKSAITTYYDDITVDGLIRENAIPWSVETAQFDNNGNLTEKYTEYKKNVWGKTEYDYDSSERTVSVVESGILTSSNNDGTPSYTEYAGRIKEKQFYNEEGFLVRYDHYSRFVSNKEGETISCDTSTYLLTYTANDILSGQYYLKSNGDSVLTDTYNDKGLVKENHHTPKRVYEYDTEGNQTKETIFYSSRTIVKAREYNEKGDMIKEGELSPSNLLKMIGENLTSYTYEYDVHGNWVVKKSFNSGGYLRSVKHRTIAYY